MTIVQQLNAAIEAGNSQEVRKLLEAHPELLRERVPGGTWLHLAASEDNPAIVEALVEAGLDVNSPREEDGTSGDLDDLDGPLFDAASFGSVKVVRWLLDHGADLNGGAALGTPLVNAATEGHLPVVQLLLDRGADIHVCYGNPPINALSQALMFGHEEVAKLLRAHGATEPGRTPRTGPTNLHEEIVHHMEQCLGPVQRLSLQEIVPGSVPVSIHVIPPGPERDYLTLFTTGMSDQAMTVPKGGEPYQYAELLMYLPPDWPLDRKALDDPRHFWPIEWLRRIAHYPHDQGTWLGGRHAIVSNGEPPAPLARNTQLTSLLLLTNNSELGCFRTSFGRSIVFYTLIPIYTEERDLERAKGTAHLVRLFEQQDISLCVDVGRPNVAQIPLRRRKKH